MPQLGDLITYLADREQSKGVSAVIDTLKEIGVLREDHERQCLSFHRLDVSGEQFSRLLDQKLREQ